MSPGVIKTPYFKDLSSLLEQFRKVILMMVNFGSTRTAGLHLHKNMNSQLIQLYVVSQPWNSLT
jgi:hypothetical protein